MAEPDKPCPEGWCQVVFDDGAAPDAQPRRRIIAVETEETIEARNVIKSIWKEAIVQRVIQHKDAE